MRKNILISVKLNKWRCREVSSKLSSQVSRIWPSTDTGVEQVLRYKNIRHKRWGSIDPPSVEKLSKGQELSWLIHQVLRRCRDCDKKKSLEAWQIARCKRGVELAFKISFSRREKHRHECNQACNTTNDPNTILTSQNNLSAAILSTWIPKTHTHTLNRSNQFYISKIS